MKPIVLALLVVTACTKAQETNAPPPAQAPADVAAVPPPAGGDVTGRIELAGSVESKVAAGDVIYLIARNAATDRTIAVAKLAAPEKFPLDFHLSSANVMMPGSSLAGKVKLLARVDKDGDAMTKAPGDVVGEVPSLVEVPAKDVVLQLDGTL